MRVRSRSTPARPRRARARELRFTQHQRVGLTALAETLPIAGRLFGARLLLGQRHARLNQIGLGHLERGLVVAGVDLGEHLAGFEELPFAKPR